MDCGEGMDSSTLSLPGDQLGWFLFVRESKKPLISIVVAGRPYAISERLHRRQMRFFTAFILAHMVDLHWRSFFMDRKVRLAVCQFLYQLMGQLPVYYNPKRSYEAMKYWDEEAHALYEFGEGIWLWTAFV